MLVAITFYPSAISKWNLRKILGQCCWWCEVFYPCRFSQLQRLWWSYHHQESLQISYHKGRECKCHEHEEIALFRTRWITTRWIAAVSQLRFGCLSQESCEGGTWQICSYASTLSKRVETQTPYAEGSLPIWIYGFYPHECMDSFADWLRLQRHLRRNFAVTFPMKVLTMRTMPTLVWLREKFAMSTLKKYHNRYLETNVIIRSMHSRRFVRWH